VVLFRNEIYLTLLPTSKRTDYCTQHDWTEVKNEHWDMQMTQPVDVYLDFRAHEGEDGILRAASPKLNNASSFQVEIIDVFCVCSLHTNLYVAYHHSVDRRTTTFSLLPGEIFPNEALVRNGFLGATPMQSDLAFSLRALTCYRQNHRTCPRFSIEARCKALCHLHKVFTTR
jgi:hypothetical protein